MAEILAAGSDRSPPASRVTFNTSQEFAGMYVPAHGRRSDFDGVGRACMRLCRLRRSPSRSKNAEAAIGQNVTHMAFDRA
jgi:hypothetical protein